MIHLYLKIVLLSFFLLSLPTLTQAKVESSANTSSADQTNTAKTAKTNTSSADQTNTAKTAKTNTASGQTTKNQKNQANKNQNKQAQNQANKNQRKKSKRKLSSGERPLTLLDVNGDNLFKSPIESPVLKKQLSQHLNKIEKVCDNGRNFKAQFVDLLEAFEKLKTFIDPWLKEPHLEDGVLLKIIHRHIPQITKASVEKIKNSDELKDEFKQMQFTFAGTYRTSFNLPEQMPGDKYPDVWAQKISRALTCIAKKAKIELDEFPVE